MAAKFRMLHVLSRRILIFTNAAAACPPSLPDSMAERYTHVMNACTRFTYGPLPLLARSGICIANIIHNFANII